MTSFDLLREPWVPILRKDGGSSRLGILGIFQEAEDILTIGTEIPTQRFALHRLLLAILHRAFDGPETMGYRP